MVHRGVWLSAILLCSLPAFADNLVQNPGFETGDFTGWVTTPAPFFSDNFVFPGSPFANSGVFGAAFGATGIFEDTISQTLPTVAGDTYNVSFWLTNLADAPGQADFFAFWNNQEILDAPSSAFPFTQETFTLTALGDDVLSFSGREVPAWYSLDDISVTAAVPEPGYLALLGLALPAVLCLTRRRAQSR